MAPAPPRPDVQGARNPKAVWSLVLGVVGIWPLVIVGPIFAIGLGRRAQREIAESFIGTQSGSGLARAGIVLGWFGLGFQAATVIAFIAFEWSGIPG